MSVPGSWFPVAQFFDDDGAPLAGGFVAFKVTGEDTDKDTFTTSAMSVANTNPVELDANGRATIFTESGGYDVFVTDADDNPIWQIVNYEDIGQTYATSLGQIQGEGEKDLTGNYTVTNDDNSITLGTASSKTVTLQAAADRELPLYIYNLGASTWSVTPFGSETINGDTGAYSLLTTRAILLTPITGGWLRAVMDTE